MIIVDKMDPKNHIKLGDYELIQKLEEGGMSEIFLAHSFANNSHFIIIKKLKQEFVYDQSFVHLLSSEVKTLQLLDHPNIIKAHDFISQDEDIYAILEYVDGYSLRQIMDFHDEHKTIMPLQITLYIIEELVKALSYLHNTASLEIIHSDLNPRNILISKTGQIKLIDFSIAQTAENKLGDTAGVGRGVISYMSPEQAKSESIDARSDIFSAGILLHESILNEIPFAGKSRFEVYCRLMDHEITLENLPSTLEPSLKKILVKSLKKNRDERYQTMKELHTDLEHAILNLNRPFLKKDVAKYLSQFIK